MPLSVTAKQLVVHLLAIAKRDEPKEVERQDEEEEREEERKVVIRSLLAQERLEDSFTQTLHHDFNELGGTTFGEVTIGSLSRGPCADALCGEEEHEGGD